MDFLQGFSWVQLVIMVLGFFLSMGGAGWVGLKIKAFLDGQQGSLAAMGVMAVGRIIDEVTDFFAAKYPDSELVTFLDDIVDEILKKAGLVGININKATARRLAIEKIAIKGATQNV